MLHTLAKTIQNKIHGQREKRNPPFLLVLRKNQGVLMILHSSNRNTTSSCTDHDLSTGKVKLSVDPRNHETHQRHENAPLVPVCRESCQLEKVKTRDWYSCEWGLQRSDKGERFIGWVSWRSSTCDNEVRVRHDWINAGEKLRTMWISFHKLCIVWKVSRPSI